MAIPFALLKKGMDNIKKAKGKAKPGSPAEEKGESKQFEAGEEEGMKEYCPPTKGKK
jgi:hypothetical protein